MNDALPTPAERRERELWLERLGEASVLPVDDPARQAVEAEVAGRGGWALAHWQALGAEGDAWRRALGAIEPPEDLTARLQAIPHQNRVARPGGPRRVPGRLGWAVAALLLVGVAGAWAFLAQSRDRQARIQEVALLALGDHLDTHEQDVHTDDPQRLAEGLQPSIPFALDLPDLRAVAVLVGGRRCTLGSHPVAFTAWRGRRGRLTALQLRREDFGLPAEMPPRVVRPRGEAARGQPLDVLFFGRGPFVWLVVADDREDLREVHRAFAKL